MPLQLIKAKLRKTKDYFRNKLGKILIPGGKVSPENLEEIEAVLIQSDIGVDIASGIVETISRKGVTASDLFSVVKDELKIVLKDKPPLNSITKNESGPTIILLLGVNGTGKTTTSAKLAHRFKKQGSKVLLAAADTFRAAAVEQLEAWGERIGVDVIKHTHGADPSAVCYDAVQAAIKRKVDYLLIDTAGRFHTKLELVEELKKIDRTINKCCSGAPHERLLVIDANTGQNGLVQAIQFNNAMKLTGVVVAKLDGTAKGGILIAIQKRLGIPIKFIGLGQQLGDLEVFDPESYIDAII